MRTNKILKPFNRNEMPKIKLSRKEKSLYEIGEIIFGWELIEIEKDNEKYSDRVWKCICSCCGEEKVILGPSYSATLCEKRKQQRKELEDKLKQEVGLNKIIPVPDNIEDFTGRRRKYLNCIGLSFLIDNGIRQTDRFWLCECLLCGEGRVIVSEFEFVGDRVHNCGCRISPQERDRRIKEGKGCYNTKKIPLIKRKV